MSLTETKHAPHLAPHAHAYRLMDALRAVAAIVVVVNHARDLFVTDFHGGGIVAQVFYAATGFGHEAVMIFFVLSGFWISRSVVGRAARNEPFWAPYLVDRLSRLWIVLIPALVLGGCLDYIGSVILHAPVYLGGTGAHSIARGGPHFSLLTMLGNLGFLQSLAVPVLGVNGPLWSLAYEFWFYIWFPAAWLVWRRRPSLFLLGFIIAVLYPDVLIAFGSWLCGTLLYMALARHDRSGAPLSRRMGYIILTAGLFATVAALLASRAGLARQVADLTIAASFACFLFGALISDIRFPRSLGFVARYGADSSFSLYATHFPIVALCSAVLVPTARLPLTLQSAALVAAVTAGATVFGLFFSRLTEARTRWLRDRLQGMLASRRVMPDSASRPQP